jgi:hypothetical protein
MGRLYPARNPWYTFLETESTPGHMVLSVGTEKYPVTPPGIDPETVRSVAQCLNHYATPSPLVGSRMTDYSLVGLDLIPVTIRNFCHSHRVRTACSCTHQFKSYQRLSLWKILLTAAAHTPLKRFLSSPKAETRPEAQQPPSVWLPIIISLKIKLLHL